jgi:hypothetical protein
LKTLFILESKSMNKPLLLPLIISGILLSGCENVPVQSMAASLGVPVPSAGGTGTTSSAPAQQEVWVDSQGFQASQQEVANCDVNAQIITQKERQTLGEHQNLLNIIGDKIHDSMEESKQLTNCMQGKNYVKIKALPGKMPPQRTYATNPGYAPAPAPNYAPNGYAPVQQAPAYAPNGYVPVQQAPTYAPNGYAVQQAPTYAPSGYAPVQQQAPVYAPNGYAPVQQQAPVYAPNGYAPVQQAPTYR